MRWREVLLSSVAEEALAQRIREATPCGLTLGSQSFVKELEQLAERRLHPLPHGRSKANNERQTASQVGQLTLEVGWVYCREIIPKLREDSGSSRTTVIDRAVVIRPLDY